MLPRIGWLLSAALLQAGALEIASAMAQIPSSTASQGASSTVLGRPSAVSAKSSTRPRTAVSPIPTLAPPRVILLNGTLLIEGNHAQLGQVLQQLATTGDMAISGDISDTPVQGTIGPGSPRAVIADLLRGSGHNFMMVGGSPDGLPRSLVLSTEKTASAPFATGTSAGQSLTAAGTVAPEQEPQLGPGAIAHVPPPPPENVEQRMQQTMKRLQQQHDSMSAQQAAPQ